MLFYLNQFELHLKENILKKGFLLFQNGQVYKHESMGKFVVKENEITLQIKNNQLKRFSCQCQKLSYCEHLAATLFFIQQQKLQLNVDVYTPSKIKSSKPNNQLNDIQQIIFKASLVDYSNDKEVAKSKSLTNYFSSLLNLLLSNLKAFNNKMPLNQNQIDELIYVIRHASELIQTNAQKHLSFDWYLALYSFFMYLEDFRFEGDESALNKIHENIEQQLKQIYTKGLDVKQRQSWLKATLLSIQSNKNIKNKAFYLLVPHYLMITNKQEDLKKIETLFKKRIYKKPYDEALDKTQIVLHMLYFKIHQAPKKINFDSGEIIEPEYLIALCDFYFLKKKPDKAFQLVDNSIQHYLSKNNMHLRTFTVYAIEKSRAFNLIEKEIKYLRIGFIYNLYINDAELKRYKKLINKAKLKEELNDLITKIKEANGPFSFEKISTLLMLTEKYDELIKILVQEKNKFKLLNDIILKSKVPFDSKLMKLYAKQLGYALQEANTFSRQKQIIIRCKDLLETLAEEKLLQMFDLIMNETGHESQIGKFILNEFEGLMV
jgi:hypothetical protein